MNRPISSRLTFVIGVALAIFLVIAGTNLYGKDSVTKPKTQERDQSAAAIVTSENVDSVESTAAANVSAFEECAAAGYVGIGIDPKVNDSRVNFLVELAADAEDVDRLMMDTWCSVFLDDGLGGEESRQSDYSVNQLSSWFSQLNRYSRFREGFTLASEGGSATNRLWYLVRTELNRRFILAKAAEAGIPKDAIDVEIWEMGGLDDPPVKEISDYGVQISVSYSYSGNPDDAVRFGVSLSSHGKSDVSIDHGEESTAEIFVLTEDGRQVWRSGTAVISESGRSSEIKPGRPVQFEKNWSLVNDDGFSVPSQRYLIRGCAYFSYDSSLTDGELLNEMLCTKVLAIPNF
ncbi:hypothetical protein JYU04_03015 [Dehalococcoides mccartyi]|nr:hypothetical protein [Dehalococcoides mccartyi]